MFVCNNTIDAGFRDQFLCKEKIVMNRYVTVYRGNVTKGKEFTEIGFKPKYLLR